MSIETVERIFAEYVTAIRAIRERERMSTPCKGEPGYDPAADEAAWAKAREMVAREEAVEAAEKAAEKAARIPRLAASNNAVEFRSRRRKRPRLKLVVNNA